MKRRNFLRTALGSALGAGTFLMEHPLMPGIRFARAEGGTNGKVLVVIFQRGGCDGLNTVIPYGDEAYYDLRPTIGITQPSSDPASAIPIEDPLRQPANLFGLHPSLAPIKSLYDSGNVAIFPAVQFTGASRSHFQNQDLIESGAATTQPDGWLNRHLQNTPLTVSSFRAASMGSSLPKSLRGLAKASVVNNALNFHLEVPLEEEPALLARLEAVYGQEPGSAPNRRRVHETGIGLLNDLDVMNNISLSDYPPTPGVSYPANGFGNAMMQTAQLIKASRALPVLDIQVIAMDIASYDHHSNQGGATGQQATLHAVWSNAIEALYADLGPTVMNDVVVLTETEFGRTCRENASLGTDHGNASAWFAVGGAVQGGIFGDWPGLQSDQLFLGSLLQHTVDFRDIYGEILMNHLGHASLSGLLPGHSYNSIGFL